MSAAATTYASLAAIEKSPGYWTGVIRRFRRDPVAMVALAIVIALVLMALLAPYIAPVDPYRSSMIRRLRPVGTPGFPLGTDELGRDMLSRLIYGARLSLLMGVTPVFIAFFIGSAIGITAGFLGGRVNTLLMRTIDVFFAFPSVLLAIALSGALGAGIFNGLLSLTIVFVPPSPGSLRASPQRCGKSNISRQPGRRSNLLRDRTRACAGKCDRADLRLCHGADFGVADPGFGPLLPRPRREAAGAGMGADAEHSAQCDLCSTAGGGVARADDFHHLDLVQPALRRVALSHGYQGMMTAAAPPPKPRPVPMP